MSKITCPNCGAQVEDEATFCDNCGASLAAPVTSAASTDMSVNCPQCGNSVLATDSYCSNCGATLSGAPAGEPASAKDELQQQIALSVAFSPATCPNCRSIVQAGDRFCDNCGNELEPASGYPESPQIPAEAPARPAPPNPRLLVQPGGTELPLPADKDIYVIGREDPASGSYPEVDLVPYGGEEGGVSRRHAQITRNGPKYFIEDLNSVNYTFVNRQKIAVGVAHPLQDGDEVRLGRVLLRFKSE